MKSSKGYHPKAMDVNPWYWVYHRLAGLVMKPIGDRLESVRWLALLIDHAFVHQRGVILVRKS